MQKEKWKDIEGYEGFYMISSHGRVKSLSRVVSNALCKNSKTKERILKSFVDNSGYTKIGLGNSKGKTIPRKMFSVHRLVAQAFIRNPENKPNVNHIDSDRSNNIHTNLEWCTQSENVKHGYRYGHAKPMRGSQNGRSKLDDTDVLKIRGMHLGGVNCKDISQLFPISAGTVRDIVARRTWNHI